MKTKIKPDWVIKKEQIKSQHKKETIWLFGLHAVRMALSNSKRKKIRLMATTNGIKKISNEVVGSGLEPEIYDSRNFNPPIDKNSVHQGVALEVIPLDWGSMSDCCKIEGEYSLVLLLDRVSDPHNVGAILRSAEVFGALAVIAPKRYSSPETGALAKSASGALERQAYLRVPNLSRAQLALKEMGYTMIGLDQEAPTILREVIRNESQNYRNAVAIVLGAEGSGLRALTKVNCDIISRIGKADNFGSLNVSNAAAISLYEAKSNI